MHRYGWSALQICDLDMWRFHVSACVSHGGSQLLIYWHSSNILGKTALEALAMRAIVLGPKSTAQMAHVDLSSESVFVPGDGVTIAIWVGSTGLANPFTAKMSVCGENAYGQPVIPSLPPWLLERNTTDGTSGGPKPMTWNVVCGYCCNESGSRGSERSDCGAGWWVLSFSCQSLILIFLSSTLSLWHSTELISSQPKWCRRFFATAVLPMPPRSSKLWMISSYRLYLTSSKTSTALLAWLALLHARE